MLAAYDAVLRLVTIAEIFAGERLVDVVEQRLPDHDLVLGIWDERSRRITGDWRGRQTGWRELFNIAWNYPGKNEFDGFIAARNIITHGLGQVTRSQLRRDGTVKPEVKQRLADAGLRLRGLELVVEVDDVQRCARRVAEVIRWLDRQAIAIA